MTDKDTRKASNGQAFLYLRGARLSSNYPASKTAGFSVDKVVFDDCCFSDDPCDNCKKAMDGLQQ